MVGIPGKGIHSYRIFDIAIVDTVETILVALAIAYFTNNMKSFPYILGGLFFLGIVLHRLFCVRTTVDKFLFPNIHDE
uniref:Uncharacterized protein n=1 Tax=viral metagenome TaxID=1070528 RepID=A0A6C0D3S9_9ZZZZ